MESSLPRRYVLRPSLILVLLLGGAVTAAVSDAPPGPAPEGMVWVPGGEFWMGSDVPEFDDARPWHRVQVDGFWMDTHEVTNAQYAEFVAATDYVTVAERVPKAEDYPGVPAENLVAGSVVFTPPPEPVPLGNWYQWWQFVPGADWRHPQGPDSNIDGKDNYPVVHIAYEDAEAYARWAGKRLPTEAEYERALRGKRERAKFAWGDDFTPEGRYMANTFQGEFPHRNDAKDGHIGAAPVASYPANDFGLHDLAGNVWEWCSDWYRPDEYERRAQDDAAVVNPQGPPNSYDPQEPGVPKRVHRGGSYLCSPQYCIRYSPGGRGKGAIDTGTNHLGFRCVQAPAATRP